jgi:hypothetical protein
MKAQLVTINGDAKVSKVNTELQDADFLMKGLPREPFERNRRRAQGGRRHWCQVLGDRQKSDLCAH